MMNVMKKNKINTKTISRVLLYVSFLYLIYYLYRKGIVQIPEEINYTVLGFSGFVLVISFIIHGLSFKVLSRKYGIYIKSIDSLMAFGMFIITRYLPGKIWVFVGPASFYNDKYGYPMDKLLTISLTSQFLDLWVGLAICSVAVMFLPVPLVLSILCLISWLALSLVLFTQYTHRIVSTLFSKFTKKKIDIPWISFREIMNVLPFYGLIWVLYSFSFLLMGMSIGAKASTVLFFSFPIATIIGMIAIFVPGGLGVREGALVYILTLGGAAIVQATTISAFSRLWFFAGEIIIFIMGICLNIIIKNKKQDNTLM